MGTSSINQHQIYFFVILIQFIKIIYIITKKSKTLINNNQLMMKTLALLFCLACSGLASETTGDRWEHYQKAVQAMEQSSILQEAWKDDHIGKFEKGRNQAIPENMLNCPDHPPSPNPPTSVHALRPADVKLVAAIGDSLTAANGALASTPLGLLTEYRGRAFAVGGDKDATSVVTMPNILRTHNDDLDGHSVRTGKKGTKNSRLNFAVPGSTAANLHTQALELVDQLRQDPNVDFNNDWKVITVFVGGNDACNYFDGQVDENTPDMFIAGIKKAIDVFNASVPKAFVNLVEVLDLSILPDLSKGFICPMLHKYLCKHIASGKDNDKVKELIGQYNKKIEDLIGSGKGHAAAGEALWNNMMEPVGQKQVSWNPDYEQVKCPNKNNPYFSTYKNSPGGFAAFAALPRPSSTPSGDNTLMIVIVAVAAFVGIVAVAALVIRRRRNRFLGESLENLPVSIEIEANKITLSNEQC